MPVARCPICDTPLAPAPGDAAVSDALRWRPFCSKRCKLVDLSKWLGEEYRVAGPALGDGGPRATHAGSAARDAATHDEHPEHE